MLPRIWITLLVVLSLASAGAVTPTLTITHQSRALQPGELVVLTVVSDTALSSIEVKAFNHTVRVRALPPTPATPHAWLALVGIDLDVKPGNHLVSVSASSKTGRTAATHALTVIAKTFATRRLSVDPDFVNPPASEAARIEREAAALAVAWKGTEGPDPVPEFAFIAPVPHKANSAFGTRSVFNGQARSAHSGADFLSPAGTSIKAPAPGKVVLADNLYFSGGTVVVDHGLGVVSLFAHMSKIVAKAGDLVARGDELGLVGATGRVTGPHLHWTVRVNESRVDPLSLVALLAPKPAQSPVTCEGLAAVALPNAEVTRAQLVPAGQFSGTPAGILAPGERSFRPYNTLPTFCRIAATLRPTADSQIKMELWLPTDTWNGKFAAVGNGGWAGQVSMQALVGPLGRGYAIATTDTGHDTPGASFALGHPEKLIDFAYRAVHEMTVHAKAFVRAYYAVGPETSYWVGCSTGGRQGLKEAQRYPDDYDGIVAGAPANNMTHLLTQGIWVAQAVLKDPISYVPKEKYAVLHQAVIAACDGLDGVTDGVLEDPRTCQFDPKVIQCPVSDGPTCLTPAQVEAVRKIYGPARNPRTGIDIYPGQTRGSELGWATGLAAPTPLSIATDYFKFVVFKNPEWDFRTLNFDADVALADRLDSGGMNATDPNLDAFVKRGGKLLMYHGWNDPLIAPQNSVNYFADVMTAMGGADKTAESVRLFMLPGAGHCAGGEGPSNFDPWTTIEQWVEQKTAPDQIVASRLSGGAVDRTRPLCPYPQVAVYQGSGDTNKAENFACRTPVRK